MGNEGSEEEIVEKLKEIKFEKEPEA